MQKNKYLSWLLIISGVLLLSACEPKYQQQSWWSGGYSSTQIDQNTFRVSYEGDIGTDAGKVNDFLMYRAAELTMQSGYDYFVFTNKDVTKQTQTQCQQQNNFDNKKNKNNYPTSSTKNCSESVAYTVTANIKMYKGKKPESNINAYDAMNLMQYMGPNIKR